MPEGWGPPQRHTLAPCPARESLVSSLKSCFYVMVTYAQQMLLFRSRLGCGPGALRDPLGRTSVVTIFTPNLPSARNGSTVPVRRQRPLPPRPQPWPPPSALWLQVLHKGGVLRCLPFRDHPTSPSILSAGLGQGHLSRCPSCSSGRPDSHSVRLPCFSLIRSSPPPPPPPRRVLGVFPHRTIVELITF